MAKTRLKSKFLDHDPGVPQRQTYKASLVWRWLQCVKPGTDDIGIAVKAMRDRMDMPNRFSNRTQIATYLTGRCKQDPQLVNRVVYQLWNMYSLYRDSLMHDLTPVGEVPTTQVLPTEPIKRWADPDDGNARSRFLSR